MEDRSKMAVDHCSHEWIFSLDADERVSSDLENAIEKLKTLPKNELADGYKISRLAYYMQRPIRHSGWYPDWQLRFFNRNKGRWKDMPVHESIQMNEKALKYKSFAATFCISPLRMLPIIIV